MAGALSCLVEHPGSLCEPDLLVPVGAGARRCRDSVFVSLAPIPFCSIGQIEVCGCASYRREQGAEEVHKEPCRADRGSAL
jgi:hypothetical protein